MGRRSTVQNRCLLTKKTTGRGREEGGSDGGSSSWPERKKHERSRLISKNPPGYQAGSWQSLSAGAVCGLSPAAQVPAVAALLRPWAARLHVGCAFESPKELVNMQVPYRGSGLGSKMLHLWQALRWYRCSWCLKTPLGIEHPGLHRRPRESESAVYHNPRRLKCT